MSDKDRGKVNCDTHTETRTVTTTYKTFTCSDGAKYYGNSNDFTLDRAKEDAEKHEMILNLKDNVFEKGAVEVNYDFYDSFTYLVLHNEDEHKCDYRMPSGRFKGKVSDAYDVKCLAEFIFDTKGTLARLVEKKELAMPFNFEAVVHTQQDGRKNNQTEFVDFFVNGKLVEWKKEG